MMNMMEVSDSDADSAEFLTQQAKTPLWSSAAYSSALTKSMKAMISGNRLLSSRQSPTALGITDNEKDAPLVAAFADAVAKKNKETILDVLTKTPRLLRQGDENGRLPLHLVCALRPSYRFVDVMTMMVNAYPQGARSVDKNGDTPLHILCENPSVTVQALGVFAASMADTARLPDNQGNLPLHCLCINPTCEVGMIRQLRASIDSYSAVNDEGQTPLHCLTGSTAPLNRAVLLYLLESFPDAALMVDTFGRTALHWVCEHVEMIVDILRKVVDAGISIAAQPDENFWFKSFQFPKNQDLPVHILCQNAKLTPEMLYLMLQAHPIAIYALSKGNLSPLHFLCSNESCTVDLLTELFAFDVDNSVCAISDTYGAMPLHLLCMNASISAETLRTMLLMCSEDSFAQDAHGRSPLHYLCMNRSVTSELLWLFFDRGNELVRQLDKDERTPLHHLCANPGVTARILEILFDACPSAALVADLDFKLPVQYLVDNAASSTETTALLISGPASYRHRYEFLSATAPCICITQGSELVYIQTNVAMDSNSATNVLVSFYSSQTAVEHEHAMLLHLEAAKLESEHGGYSPAVYETFEGAKRRVTLRSTHVAPEDQKGDVSVTLDYALVTEAPLYTLEGLRVEKVCDSDTVRSIATEIADCLLFWHCQARMVHGNITLENLGQFEGRGLCLFNFSTSRELHQDHPIGSQGIELSSCPHEAAKAFLANEPFSPTLASDIWQFGCLIYHLLTGKKLLERLAPWSEFVGHDQSLHLICSLTDDVLAPLIAEVDPEFRLFLQRTLTINPSHRWSIDRLMRVANGSFSPSFAISETSSHEVIGDALEQKANCALVDGPAGPRAAKHAQDQLEFMKKEQAHLRHTLLAAKLQLRDAEQMCTRMQTEAHGLRVQLATVTQQKQEVQQEVQVFAHNHQTMTLQLHTTVQTLLNLIPLARKASNSVYGAGADDFLSNALSQASGGSDAASSAFQKETTGSRRRRSAVQLVKNQLQHSVLARGCVQKWANSNHSTALAATQQTSASDEDDNDASGDIDVVSAGDGDDKPSGPTGDSDDVAAAMA